MAEEQAPERICVFGGTFDPIHIGHLKVANEALRTMSLARILFVPGAHPPHKDPARMTPYEDRFRMVEIACKPYQPAFEPSRLEAGGEPSFTIDTLNRLRANLRPEDELFFLIGADAFAELKSWKSWQEVIQKTEFIVVSRPGTTYLTPEGTRVHALNDVEVPVSSSEIRRRLSGGDTVAEVPAEVREYISQHGLYRWPGAKEDAGATASP